MEKTRGKVMSEQYDAVVIGAGQGGGPLSSALAGTGLKTALIERNHVGGTCINEGCTPTKTMVASARVAHLARRAGDYGVKVGEVTIDMEKIRQRKRDIVESFRSGSRRRIDNTDGLDLLEGQARFTGPRSIEVKMKDGSSRHITAEQIFINTGMRPVTPPISGIHNVNFLDSTSIMELGEVPQHLLIIGGGYIGCEFGQMFRRFGAEVTIVQRGSQLLTREDADIAEAVADVFREDDITILFETDATGVTERSGKIELAINTPGGTRTLTGTHLLVAAARQPNTEVLDLDAAGIETDERGFIRVNNKLETNVEGVYALGDVKGGPAFTHISYDDFRILRTNLIDSGNATTDDRLVPYTVFIDPQLGGVGLTEREAQKRNIPYRVAKLPGKNIARALETDETRGIWKALVHKESGQILGASIFGVEGGEIMSVLQVAMMGKLHYKQLRDSAFAHPTFAEALNNLFAALGD
jgi:pyruvate/2-oxoglutarate dehydrogenase complex dihydrolipoamide dehydrogenase (E3) component